MLARSDYIEPELLNTRAPISDFDTGACHTV